MDGTAVFRLISLIPDRPIRFQTGQHFQPDGSPRMALIGRFLNWLGPLDALTREEQQQLGLRSGGRSLMDGEAEGEIDDGCGNGEVAHPGSRQRHEQEQASGYGHPAGEGHAARHTAGLASPTLRTSGQ